MNHYLMKLAENNEMELFINPNQLKYLRFEKRRNEYIVTLVDASGYEILKGYGATSTEAINDLHNNLV